MTTQTVGHTPLPWKADGTLVVPQDKEDGGYVADVYGDSIEHRGANIAFILRACNAHDDLAAALKECEVFLKSLFAANIQRNPEVAGPTRALYHQAKAALAKAKA